MKEIIKRTRKTYRPTGERQITCEVSYNFEMQDVTEEEMKASISSDNHNHHFAVIDNCMDCDIPPREKWDLGCQAEKGLYKDKIHPSCPIIKDKMNKNIAPELPKPNYIIVYEDQDRELEILLDEETALKRLEIVRDNWNCHLFKRVKSV